MTWTPLMRGLLALALVQVLLGGVLAVAGPGGQGVSPEDPGGVPTTEVPGSPTRPGEVPGAPSDSTPLPVPGAPPPAGDSTDPTIPPTAASPKGPRPLAIHSTYEPLRPEEQAEVEQGLPYESVVEGRVSNGVYWRLSAYRQIDEICPEKSHHDPEKGRGGSGGGGCSPRSEWALAASGPGDSDYLGMHGFAPAEAQHFELVAKDGRRGRVGGVHMPEMGVSFFVAWLDCKGPDLDRIDALAADGRVVDSYNFAEELPGVGWPSWPCNPGGE